MMEGESLRNFLFQHFLTKQWFSLGVFFSSRWDTCPVVKGFSLTVSSDKTDWFKKKLVRKWWEKLLQKRSPQLVLVKLYIYLHLRLQRHSIFVGLECPKYRKIHPHALLWKILHSLKVTFFCQHAPTCGTLLICSSVCPQGTFSTELPVNDCQLREARVPALCWNFHV